MIKKFAKWIYIRHYSNVITIAFFDKFNISITKQFIFRYETRYTKKEDAMLFKLRWG